VLVFCDVLYTTKSLDVVYMFARTALYDIILKTVYNSICSHTNTNTQRDDYVLDIDPDVNSSGNEPHSGGNQLHNRSSGMFYLIATYV